MPQVQPRKFPPTNIKKEDPRHRDDKLLLESDPFTLEQQRHFKRLRNSEVKMTNNYNNYHSSVLLPEIKKHIQNEKQELKFSEERFKTRDQQFIKHEQLKNMVIKINSDKVKEQMYEREIKKK